MKISQLIPRETVDITGDEEIPTALNGVNYKIKISSLLAMAAPASNAVAFDETAFWMGTL